MTGIKQVDDKTVCRLISALADQQRYDALINERVANLGRGNVIMSKTVNATIIVTRDGKSTTQNYDKLSYATFVALQSALSGVLAMLQSWGASRVAALADGRPARKPGGESDLRLELRADHGGGTSEVTLGYTGISEQDANEITAALLGAAASVLRPS